MNSQPLMFWYPSGNNTGSSSTKSGPRADPARSFPRRIEEEDETRERRIKKKKKVLGLQLNLLLEPFSHMIIVF